MHLWWQMETGPARLCQGEVVMLASRGKAVQALWGRARTRTLLLWGVGCREIPTSWATLGAQGAMADDGQNTVVGPVE